MHQEGRIALSDYIDIIEQHARVCLTKLKKPTIHYEIQDLINEGIVVFLSTRDKYKEEKGSFPALLKRSLKNRYSIIVRKSYKCVNIENNPALLSNIVQPSAFDVLIDFNKQVTSLEMTYLLFLIKPPMPISKLVGSNFKKIRSCIREVLQLNSQEGIEIERKLRTVIKTGCYE